MTNHNNNNNNKKNKKSNDDIISYNTILSKLKLLFQNFQNNIKNYRSYYNTTINLAILQELKELLFLFLSTFILFKMFLIKF